MGSLSGCPSYRNGSVNAFARLPSPNVPPGMICSNHSHCLPMKVQTQVAFLFGTQCVEVLTFSEWGMWVGGCLCRKNKVEVLVTQLCPALWDPMDCSLPGFSVHGISQARIVEWVAIPFSRGSSPGIKPMSPAWQGYSLPLNHLGSPLQKAQSPCNATKGKH